MKEIRLHAYYDLLVLTPINLLLCTCNDMCTSFSCLLG